MVAMATPQPFEVGFYRASANTSWSYTKQDLTANEAYHVRSCIVLSNESKFWQLIHLFSAFSQAFFFKK